MQQRQAQVQRSPTERFVDAVVDAFSPTGYLADEHRVRLEDAFNDAVDVRVAQVMDHQHRDSYEPSTDTFGLD